MAKGSERPTWAWASSKICSGCGKTCKLDDVRVFHSQKNHDRVIFCVGCYPERWGEWMKKHSLYDRELADVMQEELLRKRLRASVSGNGGFSEEEYSELVAREVERAKRAHERMVSRGVE